jgi:DNA-binding FadR family transcriptional regulator
MAKPKKVNDPADAAMSAIQQALNLREELEPRSARKAATREQVRDILEKLAKVSEQGAKNKLPGVTSDHAFLYQDGTPI